MALEKISVLPEPVPVVTIKSDCAGRKMPPRHRLGERKEDRRRHALVVRTWSARPGPLREGRPCRRWSLMLVHNAGCLEKHLGAYCTLGSKEGPALLNEARMTKVVGAFDEGNVAVRQTFDGVDDTAHSTTS